MRPRKLPAVKSAVLTQQQAKNTRELIAHMRAKGESPRLIAWWEMRLRKATVR